MVEIPFLIFTPSLLLSSGVGNIIFLLIFHEIFSEEMLNIQYFCINCVSVEQELFVRLITVWWQGGRHDSKVMKPSLSFSSPNIVEPGGPITGRPSPCLTNYLVFKVN